MSNPSTMTMTTIEWAHARGVSERSVKRWLQAGEIPAAYKIGDRWAIPADADRVEKLQVRPAHEVVALNAAKREGQGQDMARVLASITTPLEPALGALLTLADAAERLGTTVGGIRRLGDAGHLNIGPFGPNGALRVWIS